MPEEERNKSSQDIQIYGKNDSKSAAQHGSLAPNSVGARNGFRVGPRPRGNPGHSPGILDWIFDFFLTPLTKAIAKLIENPEIAIKSISPVTAIHDALRALAPAIEGIDKEISPKTIKSPSDAAAAAEKALPVVDKNLENLSTVEIMIESGTLGLVDISIDRATRLPGPAFLETFSTEIRRARLESGFLPMYTRNLRKQYTPFLPGYQDMISIYVREGYLEEKWVEIPPEFLEFMKELGYSEAWTNRLWGQHWVLPGVTLLYEMFHKKIIDRPTLVQMLKYHDFEPVWRDRLIANAWSLIPRVDLRRGYAWGIISSEQLQERYEKLGFNPEDARSMTGIAKRYGLTAYYSRLLSVASATFRKGQLSGQDFQLMMEVCGLPGEAQDLLLRAESMARASAVTQPGEEPRTLSASQICAAYTKGLLSLLAARDQLLGMGYLEGDADLLLALAAPKPASEAPATEIVSAASLLYKNGWMSPEEFEGWLREANLTPEEIAVQKDAQDLRYWFDYASDLLALWKQMYAKDLLTLEEFYMNLLRWGCQPDRAWAIVSLEETRKIPKPRVAG